LPVAGGDFFILRQGSLFRRKQNLEFPMKICPNRPFQHTRLGIEELEID
jgi:hypothetical protein